MRKLFSKRIFILAIAFITCFSSITAFSQNFVFANESGTLSSETVSEEIASPSPSDDTSTEEQAESALTYLDYDEQPTTPEEVQASIDAYVNSGYSSDAKPHWQYEVASSLIPSGWRCDDVADEHYSEGKYWTIASEAATTSIDIESRVATVPYTINLALDGITWADLADNVAVTFTNPSNGSMTLLFTDPTMQPGNYYILGPTTGALNGIQAVLTINTEWTVTADLPLSGQYYIKGIALNAGAVSGTSVTPNDSTYAITITIGKTATPWGHWIYKSQ